MLLLLRRVLITEILGDVYHLSTWRFGGEGEISLNPAPPFLQRMMVIARIGCMQSQIMT